MRLPSYRWAILAVGFMVLFFSGGSRFAFGLFLVPMSEDLGWSRSALSLLITVFMVVSAVGMLVVGRLIDQVSLRLVISLASLVGALGIGLMGQSTAWWQMFMLYGVIYAIGFAGTSTGPVSVMISRWFSRSTGLASSTAISGGAFGQLTIVMLLASVLASIGWRSSYALLGLVNLVLAPVVLVAVRSTPRLNEWVNGTDGFSTPWTTDPLSTSSAFLGKILLSRELLLLVTMYAICGFQDFFVSTHIVAFAMDAGIDSVISGNLLGVMGLMGLFGVIVSGTLADTYGGKLPAVVCFLIRVVCFAFLLVVQSSPSIIIFGLAYGLTFMATAPLTVVFAGNIFGLVCLGTVTGLINMVHQVGGGLGALVGAMIFDRWGNYNLAFSTMLVLSLIALALLTAVRERLAPIADQEGDGLAT